MPKFEFSQRPKQPESMDILVIVVYKNNLLYDSIKKTIFFHPMGLSLFMSDKNEEKIIYIGKMLGKELYAIETLNFQKQDCQLINFRNILVNLKEYEKKAAFRAFQLVNWCSTSQYCGCCGNETHLSKEEFVKVCTSCRQKSFPQYSPAVIVLVTQGENLLLGGLKDEKSMYSTLAGFVEAGETCEAAVRREVFEETGIKIKDIQYHSTQPWPFPNSLMIGFTAKYAGGVLKIDKNELKDAQWFHWSKLPLLPPKSTISTRMIEEFVESRKITGKFPLKI